MFYQKNENWALHVLVCWCSTFAGLRWELQVFLVVKVCSILTKNVNQSTYPLTHMFFWAHWSQAASTHGAVVICSEARMTRGWFPRLLALILVLSFMIKIWTHWNSISVHIEIIITIQARILIFHKKYYVFSIV